MDTLTPMLAQYRAIKREHEDVILLFRLGDFYEMFDEDAKVASRALELVLTSREAGQGRRMPMCGIPYHAVDRYVARLLAAGYKAAICEQVEDPKQAKKLVRREVIRILTPGTVVEDHLLEARASNYLVSVVMRESRWGIAAAECSTGDLAVTEVETAEEAGEEIARLGPAELLVREEGRSAELEALVTERGGAVTTWGAEGFGSYSPAEYLRRHFGVASLAGYGCEELPAAVEAVAAILAYLQRTQKSGLAQITGVRTYARGEFMLVDAASRRNLELLTSLRDGGRQHSLLWVLDQTLTPMGARRLREWVTAPLLEVARIEARLNAVEALHADATLRARLRDELKEIRDLERLVSRAAAGTATGRDLAGVRDSLRRLPAFCAILNGSGQEALQTLVEGFDLLADLGELLGRALEDTPPPTLRESGIIRDGYSPELDELRQARAHGKEWIAGLQERERARTGVKSLRVGFNQVFGYFLEVTRPNLHLVPEDYQRRQTMANAERFITPELKEWEAKVLGAEERILALEQQLFAQLRDTVVAATARIQRSAEVVARADALAGLAEVAARNRYVRPVVNESDRIEIKGGRHPVVELTLQDERFVPNDAGLNCEDDQVQIITGPNMAGKSTYLRQVALITLMAQVGSFVPAEAARIGVVDRIFTRVGASDDLASGQSTFMVEMTETANILHHATRRSLIVLDEIGRGTSTFDGLSIAWSVAEHIHNVVGAKTLFATHYHHLNELAERLPRVRNYRVAVKEQGDTVVFLRQIVPGGTDRSYGIHVARLAGVPGPVLERAKQILWSLEQRNHVGETEFAPRRILDRPAANQLALFDGAPDPVMVELASVDVNHLTPVEALQKLAELQQRAKKRQKED
jgi:DNA mismatch repair protein MutS